jgi:hypothetical protein
MVLAWMNNYLLHKNGVGYQRIIAANIGTGELGKNLHAHG